MCDSFSLINLSSFFELFVAYTFAYNGLSSFKEGVNQASGKELDEKLEANIKITEKFHIEAKDYGIVQDSSDDLKGLIKEKLEQLNNLVKEQETLNRVVKIIYSGDFLRPMFYLVGALYLLFIFLSAFQNYIGETSLLIAISYIVISVWIFYLDYYFRTIRNYFKLNYKKINWFFSTKKFLKLFFWITLLGLVFSVLVSKNIHNNYPEWKNYFDKKMFDVIQLSRKDFLYLFVVIGIISIAAIPYYIYYKREAFFIEKMEAENATVTKKINDLIKEIKTISKGIGNLFSAIK